ncbi:MAG: hypothetical protein IJV06_02425 [Bacteroidaceae bacterium]|nr:hypothetical protein [Bacteroidaceae bacterium]
MEGIAVLFPPHPLVRVGRLLYLCSGKAVGPLAHPFATAVRQFSCFGETVLPLRSDSSSTAVRQFSHCGGTAFPLWRQWDATGCTKR